MLHCDREAKAYCIKGVEEVRLGVVEYFVVCVAGRVLVCVAKVKTQSIKAIEKVRLGVAGCVAVCVAMRVAVCVEEQVRRSNNRASRRLQRCKLVVQCVLQSALQCLTNCPLTHSYVTSLIHI